MKPKFYLFSFKLIYVSKEKTKEINVQLKSKEEIYGKMRKFYASVIHKMDKNYPKLYKSETYNQKLKLKSKDSEVKIIKYNHLLIINSDKIKNLNSEFDSLAKNIFGKGIIKEDLWSKLFGI